MENKICCIFNYSPHYRKEIYHLIDKELPCDFYFGKNVPGTLKEMDYSKLSGFKYCFRNIILKEKIIWQMNTVKLLFNKRYKNYILSVDTACLSEWIILYGAWLLGKKTFLWTHGWYGNESRMTKIRKKAFYWPATGLLLYSEFSKKLMLKEGFREDKIAIIANSLNYNEQKEIRKSLRQEGIYKKHFDDAHPTIAFIGRLESKKKLSEILSIINLLKKEGTQINCILIGTGTDRKNLERKVQELQIEQQVWFYGECYDEMEIAKLLHNADVCLSPGNVGLTAIHSLSFGTPVITHNNFCNQMPEFEAIMEGENGRFFKEGDIEDMKNTVKQWLEKHPVKNEKLITNCYKIIDQKYNPYYQIEVIKQAIYK